MTMSTPSPSPPTISGTRWSLVLQQAPAQSTRAAALAELCTRYWTPVYAYLRCSGNEPLPAHDIARAFFGDLLRQAATLPSDPPRRFRDFLLAHLDAFLAGNWCELPDADAPLPMPEAAALEARHRLDSADAATPAQAFQRSYACQVIARALERLHEEAALGGHQDMYAALLPYLGADPTAADYATLSQQLGQRPLALIVALKRLRQRFRELIDRELCDTVESAAELRDEQRTLHGFLDPAS